MLGRLGRGLPLLVALPFLTSRRHPHWKWLGTTMRAIPTEDTLERAPTLSEPDSARASGPSSRRILWLDALRGLAVLAVLMDHGTYLVFPQVHRHVITPYFDVGTFGVMLFFLISGYVVPASLESHGDLRRFWTARFLRLYPAWSIAVGGWLLMAYAGMVKEPPYLRAHPATWFAAHMTMLQDLLRVPSVINVLWTLSYEMAFYMLLTGMFCLRVHRRPLPFAVAFASGAVVLGGLVPPAVISKATSPSLIVPLCAAIALLGGVLLVASRARGQEVAGGVVLALVSLALLAFNSRMGDWESLVIPAMMFAGAAFYRAEKGDARWSRTAPALAGILLLCVVSGDYNSLHWHRPAWFLHDFERSWTLALLLAGAVFCVASRRWKRRPPKVLVWIGTVSYSTYLLHPLVINVLRTAFGADPNDLSLLAQVGVACCFVVLVFALSWVSHRYVEEPARQLAKRISGSNRARWAPGIEGAAPSRSWSRSGRTAPAGHD